MQYDVNLCGLRGRNARLANGRHWLLNAILLILWLSSWAGPGRASVADAASATKVLISSDHSNCVYRTGETIRWRISVTGQVSSGGGALSYTVKKGGLTVLSQGSLTLSNGVAEVDAVMDEPGTAILEIIIAGLPAKTGRTLAGVAVSNEGIRRSSARPDDFDAFWLAKIEELAKVPIDPQLVREESDKAGAYCWKISMGNIRGTRIQGWLGAPIAAGKWPAMLIVNGAGVYRLEKSSVANRGAKGWIALNLNAHDLPVDEKTEFYEQQTKGGLKDYWTIGNDDRDSSYFLRMYLACYRAAQYLSERPDWDGKTLLAIGSSQGGLQAMVAAALHPKVTAVIAGVPAGCDLTGPEVGRSPGWPAWFYKTKGKDPAKVIQASRYYDVVNFMRQIRCPVLAGAGLIDEVCPPAGIIAAINELKGARELILLPGADHMGANNSHQPFSERSKAWQAALQAGNPVPPPK